MGGTGGRVGVGSMALGVSMGNLGLSAAGGGGGHKSAVDDPEGQH